jgi:hypothetical protein
MPYNMGMSSGRALGLYRAADDLDNSKYPKELKPGHWIWNPYNWHALGSFVKHMPWDSQVVEVKEEKPDEDLRVLAFKRPNGKLTIVVSNRSFSTHTFKLNAELKKDATFKGYRYTPEESGKDFTGIPLAVVKGGSLSPKVPDMAWEFWEEQ